jgi:drug/metabolite transporter (DMT)-like permease
VTAFTVALVLISAALHATWNLWAKQLGKPARDGTVVFALCVISAVTYAPVALWLHARGPWHYDLRSLGIMAVSAVLHVGYFVLLLRGYRRGDFSVVYPAARGTGPLFAAALAIPILGEPFGVATVAGVLLIVTGIVLLSLDGPSSPGASRGLRYGVMVGLTIGLYTLWDGWAVKQARIPPLLYYWGGEVLRTLIFAPIALADAEGRANLWRHHRVRILGIALASPIAYVLALIAFRDGPVSHLAPMREVSILFGAVLGGHLLDEAHRGRRLLAAGAFVAGVVALAFG